MKYTKTEKVEYDAKYLLAVFEPRYWEDAVVNCLEDTYGQLIPHRMRDTVRWLIDLDTGKIEGWPSGTIAEVHYKVCDAGVYSLLTNDHEVIVEKGGYVPSMLSPSGSGYGDYVIVNVGTEGKITDWNPDLSYFEEE